MTTLTEGRDARPADARRFHKTVWVPLATLLCRGAARSLHVTRCKISKLGFRCDMHQNL